MSGDKKTALFRALFFCLVIHAHTKRYDSFCHATRRPRFYVLVYLFLFRVVAAGFGVGSRRERMTYS